MKRAAPLFLVVATTMTPALAAAADAPAAGALPSGVVLAVGLALVSLLPFVFFGATAFVKIATVLQIVKSAFGSANVPSGTVVTALAVVLTLTAMAPVGARIAERAAPLARASDLDAREGLRVAYGAVAEPMREFLRSNASDVERTRFLAVAKGARGSADAQVRDDEFVVLAPAFATTELGEAFSMGFLLLLPFLVLDLVIANVLVALGLSSLRQAEVALPFKLLLFVAVDGWGLLVRGLIAGYK